MPVCRKDTTLFNYYDNLLKYYGVKRTRTNQWGHKGTLMLKNQTKIFLICDRCGELKTRTVKLLSCKRAYDVSTKTLCNSCLTKKTKLEVYGDETYNNTRSRIKTNMKRYGAVSNVKDDTGDKISKARIELFKTKEGDKLRKNTSERQKERFKNKNNHPMFGRKHTPESKNKNRESQFKYLRLHGLKSTGVGRYKSGTIFSKKNNCNIRYRSSYEYRFYRLLDICDSISYFDVEPFGIEYMFKNKKGLYYPDVLIMFKDGKLELIEIKPQKLQNTPLNIEKFKATKKFILSNNIENFLVLDDLESVKYIFKNINTGFEDGGGLINNIILGF